MAYKWVLCAVGTVSYLAKSGILGSWGVGSGAAKADAVGLLAGAKLEDHLAQEGLWALRAKQIWEKGAIASHELGRLRARMVALRSDGCDPRGRSAGDARL